MEMETIMEAHMALHKSPYLEFTPEYWLTVIYRSDNKHFSPDFLAQTLQKRLLKLSKTFQVLVSFNERID